MEKKKLTDEEIVKDIEANIKYMRDNGFDEILVDEEDMQNYIDLIQRLQGENERLTEEKNDILFDFKDRVVSAEQENAELQKQVKELTEDNLKLNKKIYDFGMEIELNINQIKSLEREVAKWISASKKPGVYAGMKCSLCGARIKYSEFYNGNHNFCHKCGAKMEVSNK